MRCRRDCVAVLPPRPSVSGAERTGGGVSLPRVVQALSSASTSYAANEAASTSTAAFFSPIKRLTGRPLFGDGDGDGGASASTAGTGGNGGAGGQRRDIRLRRGRGQRRQRRDRHTARHPWHRRYKVPPTVRTGKTGRVSSTSRSVTEHSATQPSPRRRLRHCATTGYADMHPY
jgi:hypothetical protein